MVILAIVVVVAVAAAIVVAVRLMYSSRPSVDQTCTGSELQRRTARKGGGEISSRLSSRLVCIVSSPLCFSSPIVPSDFPTRPNLSNPTPGGERWPSRPFWPASQPSTDVPASARGWRGGAVLFRDCIEFVNDQDPDQQSRRMGRQKGKISNERVITYQHSMKYLKLSLHLIPFSCSSLSCGMGWRTM
jgi:hypothetical protein